MSSCILESSLHILYEGFMNTPCLFNTLVYISLLTKGISVSDQTEFYSSERQPVFISSYSSLKLIMLPLKN